MKNQPNDRIAVTVAQLESVLMKERESLLSARSDSLEGITLMKVSLLKTLGELLNESPERYQGETLESINRCYLLNRGNADLVNHRLKITRQSLGIIARQGGDENVLLYESDGKVHHKFSSTSNVKV